MSVTNKVIWREGIFIRPQHFQQQERHFHAFVQQQPNSLEGYRYGFNELSINAKLLDQGKVALQSAQGLFPDGTPFCIPEQAQMPSPLTLPEGMTHTQIYLCLPLAMPGSVEVGCEQDLCYRYRSVINAISDNTSTDDETADIELGKLQLRLLHEDHERSDYSCLPLLAIKERRPDNKLILNKEFIPPLLDVSINVTLKQFIEEVHGLLQHRADVLAHRLTNSKQAESAVVADFMLLQLVNRYESLFFQLTHRAKLHPEMLFHHATQLMAELATYTKDSRRPEQLPAYQHDELGKIYQPLMQELRHLLSLVLEQHAVAISLVQQNFGIYVGQVHEKALLEQSVMLLGVSADVAPEQLRQSFPKQIKISPIKMIRDLVSRGIPGIPLIPLPIAPRQIPYHVNFAYFRLDQQHPLWQELMTTGAIAFHVGGHFTNLRLELWAIRG